MAKELSELTRLPRGNARVGLHSVDLENQNKRFEHTTKMAKEEYKAMEEKLKNKSAYLATLRESIQREVSQQTNAYWA